MQFSCQLAAWHAVSLQKTKLCTILQQQYVGIVCHNICVDWPAAPVCWQAVPHYHPRLHAGSPQAMSGCRCSTRLARKVMLGTQVSKGPRMAHVLCRAGSKRPWCWLHLPWCSLRCCRCLSCTSPRKKGICNQAAGGFVRSPKGTHASLCCAGLACSCPSTGAGCCSAVRAVYAAGPCAAHPHRAGTWLTSSQLQQPPAMPCMHAWGHTLCVATSTTCMAHCVNSAAAASTRCRQVATSVVRA